MEKTVIHTEMAPAAIGPYSQAVRAGDTVYLSGQIPLDPATGELVGGDFSTQAARVFDNLAAVAQAAGGSLDDVVKLNIFLTDLGQFGVVNEMMAERFSAPYPARATIQVAALPKGVPVEMDAVMVLAGDGDGS
ncbi:MAG: RidA family protein [Wenzhouxiangella sp.]|nr:MAG: RidA family protein [Wenzhouxiangella sp.]